MLKVVVIFSFAFNRVNWNSLLLLMIIVLVLSQLTTADISKNIYYIL